MTEDKRSIIQMVAGLIEQGKKNQDKIAYSKILDTFSGVEISSEQFDNILKAAFFRVLTSPNISLYLVQRGLEFCLTICCARV